MAAVPPDFTRLLVGSKGEPKDLFVRGVHNVIFSGGQPVLSSRLPLPEKANPFNFSYLPEKSGYKVLINDDKDHIIVFTAKGERVAATEEQFCGSAIGLEHDDLMAPMSKKLYVGNLSFSSTEDDVRDHFAPYGEVISVNLITDRETGRLRGFGFVEMDDEGANAAIQALDGKELGGRTLKVNEAQEKPRSGGGGGRRGGGSRW